MPLDGFTCCVRCEKCGRRTKSHIGANKEDSSNPYLYECTNCNIWWKLIHRAKFDGKMFHAKHVEVEPPLELVQELKRLRGENSEQNN